MAIFEAIFSLERHVLERRKSGLQNPHFCVQKGQFLKPLLRLSNWTGSFLPLLKAKCSKKNLVRKKRPARMVREPTSIKIQGSNFSVQGLVGPRDPRSAPTKSTISIASAKLGGAYFALFLCWKDKNDDHDQESLPKDLRHIWSWSSEICP